MNLSVQPFEASQTKAWDDFVRTSRNGTIFHTRKFLSYHPEDRFTDASLMIRDGEKIVALLPAASRNEGKKKMLVSHPGASYGGLAVLADGSVAETGEILTALGVYAKAQKFHGISLLRLPPTSLQKMYSEDSLYWAFQQGYRMTRCEMDGAIDLSVLAQQAKPEKDADSGDDLVLQSLTRKCRNKVRQAEKAKIEVTLSNDFDAFWPLLESVLGERHSAKPTHTLAEIRKLHTLLPQGFRCLTAKKDGKTIAGTVLVTIHDQAIYTLYMAQEYASQEYHPMHLLVVEAMRLALKEGKRVLHLGVSTEDGGTKINEGLFYFKESFGCRPVRRESWELVF